MVQEPSQLQLPEKKVSSSTFGFLLLNRLPCLGTSQLLILLQPLSLLIAASQSQAVFSTRCPLLPPLSFLAPSLRRQGRNPGQQGGGASSCPGPAASPRRLLGPLPPRKLSLTLSRDVPGTVRVSDCSCQLWASLLGSPKEVRGPERGWRWGSGGKRGRRALLLA